MGKPTFLGVVASIALFGIALRVDTKLAWIFGFALLAALLNWVWYGLRKQQTWRDLLTRRRRVR